MAKGERINKTEDTEGRGRTGSGERGLKDSRRQDKGLKGRRESLRLDTWQEEIIAHRGHVLLCTGRQVGKTTTFAIKAAERMISQPGCRIIVASLTEDQAHLIIVMTLTYLERNYKKLIAKKKKAPTKSSVTLTNGSKVLARPVGNTGDAIRGFTGDVLIPDEASRMPESMWIAAKPTLLTTGGEIWMCSTPFGQKGYFWECYQNKHGRFKVIHVSAEDVINDRPISDSWTIEQRESALRFLEEEKKDMSELQYAQEYLGQFIEDLRQLFSDEVITNTLTLSRSVQGLLSFSRDYFLGVDIARMGEDDSAFEIIQKIRKDIFHHVENIVTKKQLTTQTFDRIVDLEKQWKFRKIGIDAGSGSLGVGILDFLLRVPIVRKKVVDLDNAKRMLDHRGEKTGRALKEGMYFNLLMLMEKGRIKLLDDDDVRLSLKSVQYEYVIKPGQKTKLRIFGRNHDIAEGLVRAAWLANQKHLNLAIHWV